MYSVGEDKARGYRNDSMLVAGFEGRIGKLFGHGLARYSYRLLFTRLRLSSIEAFLPLLLWNFLSYY